MDNATEHSHPVPHLHRSQGRMPDVIMWHLGKWDSPVYFALVGLGVPLMGYLPISEYAKLWVALGFMTLTPFYWAIEFGELKAQIAFYGLLEPEEINAQRRSMQLLYWGVALAVVIWLFGWVGGWSFPSYGIIEWLIILHTLAVAWSSIDAVYPFMDEYLQATSSQRRFDQPH